MTKDISSETIGCDLGDKVTEVCVLGADGSERRASVRTTKKGMRAFFTRAPAHVVIEVGAHSRWVSELLEELGHRVTLANPRRVKLISQSDTKTDRHDAALLAGLGCARVKLLAPVKHRRPQAQADLAVPKARDVLVASRTRLINHIRGVMKSVGERLPRCDSEGFSRKTRELVPPALRAALHPLYETLDKLDQQIREYDKTIERIAQRYPDVEVVSQISGVGTLTGLAYVLTIDDKNRFAKSRMVGAYLGLRPRIQRSGASDPQLRISKAGDPFLRRLLVNAANYILGPFGRDIDLRRWGLELAKRGGKNGRKRAKVAVARKLAVLMHRLWMTGEVYEPVGYQQKRLEDPAAA